MFKFVAIPLMVRLMIMNKVLATGGNFKKTKKPMRKPIKIFKYLYSRGKCT
jgi:hypothetical protein